MRLALLVAASFVAAPALAQSMPQWAEPSDPTPASGPETAAAPDPPPTPTIPIDGGLGLLALAGGAYAAARLRHRED